MVRSSGLPSLPVPGEPLDIVAEAQLAICSDTKVGHLCSERSLEQREEVFIVGAPCLDTDVLHEAGPRRRRTGIILKRKPRERLSRSLAAKPFIVAASIARISAVVAFFRVGLLSENEQSDRAGEHTQYRQLLQPSSPLEALRAG